jgi:hypothetical protein
MGLPSLSRTQITQNARYPASFFPLKLLNYPDDFTILASLVSQRAADQVQLHYNNLNHHQPLPERILQSLHPFKL